MAEPLFSGRNIAKGASMPTGSPNCAKCGLPGRKDPDAGAFGKGGEGILLLTEIPSSKDREALKSLLEKLNHDLESDCWTLPVVGCRPKEGKPTGLHVNCCRPRVMEAIKKLRPRKVIVLGGTALQCVLGHRWAHEQLGTLARWRGWRTPDRDLRAWMYVTYGPSYIAKLDKNDKALINTYKRDIRNAIRHTDEPIDWDYDPEKDVRILTDAGEIKRAIRKYKRSGELVSFDYESTGLKPHAMGHEIYTASMATPNLGAVSFPFYPDIVKPWKRFLESDTPKTAHNIRYEDTWGRELLGAQTRNWVLCTMQGAHVLDNRRGVTSVEFQAYIRLGFMPWGMDTKKYLRAKGKSANNINRIKEAPIKSVLLYGGLDSLAQSMVAHLPEYKELWVGQ